MARSSETPKNYNDAVNSRDAKKWKSAMTGEINSMVKNNVWSLISRPENEKVTECKWIYAVKKARREF